jgi:hypothetical protein
MQDLDGTMGTTVPTTALDPSIEDSTTALNSSLLWQEFDDKENYPIRVDDLGIYSEHHQRLQELWNLFFKKHPPSQTNYYTNPKALKELVLAEAQMSGFNVAIQRSSIVVCGKHGPPTCSGKNSDFIPPLKRRRLYLRGVFVPLRLASLWQVDSLKEPL